MSNVILTTIPLSFHNRITYIRKVKNRYDVGNINLFPNKCTSKCQYILHDNYYWNDFDGSEGNPICQLFF